MKIIFYSMLAIMCATSGFAAEDHELLSLSMALKKSTANEFNQSVVSNGWRSPFIPSKWYLDHKSASGSQNENVQARVFGQNLAQQLDAWSDELQMDRSVVSCLAISSNLLDLADWIASTSGYGNYLLAARCQDVATVGIGRALVDLDSSLDVISNLVARLDAPWHSAGARAGVLNIEAGTNIFALGSTEASLNDVWNNGQVLLLKHSSPEMKAVFNGEHKAGFDALAQVIRRRGVKSIETPLFMQNLDFFKDDRFVAQGRPSTLIRKWNAKWHGKFVMGLQSLNASKIKALLIFREHVGSFPARPQFTAEQQAAVQAERSTAKEKGIEIVPFESAFSSPGEAAFAQAWKQYATEETRNLDGLAWTTYKEITSGEFADEDTRETRETALLKMTHDQGHTCPK